MMTMPGAAIAASTHAPDRVGSVFAVLANGGHLNEHRRCHPNRGLDPVLDPYQCRTLNIVDVMLALHRIVFDGPGRTDSPHPGNRSVMLCRSMQSEQSGGALFAGCGDSAASPSRLHDRSWSSKSLACSDTTLRRSSVSQDPDHHRGHDRRVRECIGS